MRAEEVVMLWQLGSAAGVDLCKTSPFVHSSALCGHLAYQRRDAAVVDTCSRHRELGPEALHAPLGRRVWCYGLELFEQVQKVAFYFLHSCIIEQLWAAAVIEVYCAGQLESCLFAFAVWCARSDAHSALRHFAAYAGWYSPWRVRYTVELH